jgi:Rieske Fe-S protein
MKSKLQRREFCGIMLKTSFAFVAAGVAGGKRMEAFAQPGSTPAPIILNLTDPRYSLLLTVGTAIKIPDPNNSTRPMIVNRLSTNNVVALSSQCTFDGCELPVPTNGVLTCPCCGSQFDVNGNVVRGPATDNLTLYFAELTDSNTITISFVNTAVKNSDDDIVITPIPQIHHSAFTIRITLPLADDRHTLVLVDQRGRLIRRYNGPGPNVVVWSTRGLATGIYLLCLYSGNVIRYSKTLKLCF